jgi:hypothetical protein
MPWSRLEIRLFYLNIWTHSCPACSEKKRKVDQSSARWHEWHLDPGVFLCLFVWSWSIIKASIQPQPPVWWKGKASQLVYLVNRWWASSRCGVGYLEWVILGLGGSGTSPTKQWELVGGAGLWRRSGNWWRRRLTKPPTTGSNESRKARQFPRNREPVRQQDRASTTV